MSVILIGYRGSGKSSIGKRLADQLWLKFVDTDELVVQAAGKSIREIFEQDGEARFRELETAAIQQALAAPDTVISLGGGAVLREENRALIKSSGRKCVFLRAEPAVLIARIQADPQTAAARPALTQLGGGIEEVKQLLAVREPLYREVKTAELDVSNLSIDEAVVYITRLL